MRLIDAESLEDGLHYRVRLYHDEDVQLCVTANQIDATPTIDAVPVVRCRECVHFEPFRLHDGFCKIDGMLCDNDFFCKTGRRREDGDNGAV